MSSEIHTKPVGIKRLILAFGHSARALRWLARHEAAFRQEVALLAITLVALVMLPASLYEKAALLCATLFVMFAEIVNTAIEAAIDRIGLEHHPLSGLAKDLGSAAVFIAMAILVIAWGCVLYQL